MRQSASDLNGATRGPLDSLAGTAEAAFACDERCRIVHWNRAAQELLGHESDAAPGRKCHEVVRGKDLAGNRFCSERCALRVMVERREPIHAFPLVVASASGELLAVQCATVVLPAARTGRYRLLHLLSPRGRQTAAPECRRRSFDLPVVASSTASADGAPPDPRASRSLTTREMEVLRLLAAGLGTRQVARGLGISVTTSRNQIQHILAKLEAHSRLQAVCIARRHDLL